MLAAPGLVEIRSVERFKKEPVPATLAQTEIASFGGGGASAGVGDPSCVEMVSTNFAIVEMVSTNFAIIEMVSTNFAIVGMVPATLGHCIES